MRTSWKIFFITILLILGLQLYFFESLAIVKLPGLLEKILFTMLMIGVAMGIWSRKYLAKDLSTMAVIVILGYFFTPNVEWLVNLMPSIVIKIIALICIIIASILVTILYVSQEEKNKKDS